MSLSLHTYFEEKNMLKNPIIQNYCTNNDPTQCEEGYRDISDQNNIKDNDFFKNGLRIILFQDAFEICNPLGSSKTKFKLVGVYMVLGNLPPHMRSKIDNIKLVALCREKYITRFGWDLFLNVLMKDLKNLETQGIKVSISGHGKFFKGSLLYMLGDNLGSHDIGRFVKNFSKSVYFCRFCLIRREQLQSMNYEIKALRNEWNYATDAETAATRKSLCFGISGNSSLNSLQHFHVAKPGLPLCTAHDIYEGFAPYDLLLGIIYFIKKNGLNWDI